MNKIKTTITAFALTVGLASAPLLPTVATAAPAEDIRSGVTAVNGGKEGAKDDFGKGVQNVVNLLLFILGLAAVLAIILGGFRYVTSNGDAGQVKTARDIILYACVGLVVALLAFAIVNFVITSFT